MSYELPLPTLNELCYCGLAVHGRCQVPGCGLFVCRKHSTFTADDDLFATSEERLVCSRCKPTMDRRQQEHEAARRQQEQLERERAAAEAARQAAEWAKANPEAAWRDANRGRPPLERWLTAPSPRTAAEVVAELQAHPWAPAFDAVASLANVEIVKASETSGFYKKIPAIIVGSASASPAVPAWTAVLTRHGLGAMIRPKPLEISWVRDDVRIEQVRQLLARLLTAAGPLRTP